MVVKKFNEHTKQWDIELSGEVEIANADDVKTELAECAKTGKPVIDCTELTYIDSTGLGMLVSVNRVAKQHGTNVKLFGLKPHILKIFELTNLNKLFEMGE